MTPHDCLTLLGLGNSASIGEIKQAYRRRAQELHPDKHGGDAAARHQFVAMSRAYRSLMTAARAVEEGQPIGVCSVCGEFGAVSSGVDGQPRCDRCIFRPPGGRLLPLPVEVVVKCGVTIALLLVSAYLLVTAFSTGRRVYAAGALAAGVAGLTSLVYTCLTILYCTHSRKPTRHRIPSRRKQSAK